MKKYIDDSNYIENPNTTMKNPKLNNNEQIYSLNSNNINRNFVVKNPFDGRTLNDKKDSLTKPDDKIDKETNKPKIPKNSEIIEQEEKSNMSKTSNFNIVNNCEANESFIFTNEFLFNTSEMNTFQFQGFPQGFTHFPSRTKSTDDSFFVNFQRENIPRCFNQSCLAYINPYCVFNTQNNGRTWICNLCFCENETPDFYYCSLDSKTSLRTDILTRKELIYTSIEVSSHST